MTDSHRAKQSGFMEWAKLRSGARFNLAASGVLNVSASEFPALAEPEVTGPGGYGYEPLQQRIARHCGVPEECVVATTGTSMANHLAMAAAIDPGDEVLIEQPAYGPLVDVANYLGARVKRIERTFEAGFAVELDRITKAITPATRLIVLTNFHNPTGALIAAEMLRMIGEVAQRTDSYVLVDEAYLEMAFDSNAPFAFSIGQSLGKRNPFIVTNSLTKTYGLSGLRCGWILASPELARCAWRLNDLFGVNAAHPAEQMSVIGFDHLEQFRERARKLLKTNRALLQEFLDPRDDLECLRCAAGSIVFPRLAHGDAEIFVKILRDKYETSVVPGKFFGSPEHFRIGIGGNTDNVCGGLERLGAALDEFGR